jgi:hypothetical protein
VFYKYNESTVATKKSNLVTRCNTLHQNRNLDSDVFEFNTSREIVEIVIADLFFRPEDELASAETENMFSRGAKIKSTRLASLLPFGGET